MLYQTNHKLVDNNSLGDFSFKISSGNFKKTIFQIDRNLPNNVVPLQQYIPVYNPQLTYQQYLPRENIGLQNQRASPRPVQNNLGRGPPVLAPINPTSDEPVDPKQVIANLKRNPEIPDVPPPALPVKTS